MTIRTLFQNEKSGRSLITAILAALTLSLVIPGNLLHSQEDEQNPSTKSQGKGKVFPLDPRKGIIGSVKAKSRLGFKPYDPFLDLRTSAKRTVEFDPETGAVFETITMQGSGTEEMVIEVHHYSVFDYLKDQTANTEQETFDESSESYVSGEEAKQRTQASRGIMPEINLPDFMPKSLASIIGEGTGSLSIHGRSTTELSGTTTYQEPENTGLIRRESKFPRLKLDQRQQINIDGTIGSKIKVFVDYNSQNEFENRNKIEVHYEGDEDEILQSLELGDINLSLPPSMLVAANIPRGNFGIKGQTRLGKLTTTFIASKEEGESSNKNINIPVSGEAEAADTAEMFDVDYVYGQHFLLVDTSRIANHLIQFLDQRGVDLVDPNEKPAKLRVFYDDGDVTNNISGTNLTQPGYLFVDPNDPDDRETPDYDWKFGQFEEMVLGTDYILEQCGVVISIKRYMGPNFKVGVIYEEQDGTDVGKVDGDTLYMKMIKASPMTSDHPVWPLMLKNVYRFGESYGTIDRTNFSIEIFTKQTPPRYDDNGIPLLQIFGLDNDKDNKVDPQYIDFERGLIFFPFFEPFRQPYPEGSGSNGYNLDFKNTRMYTEDDPSNLDDLKYQEYEIHVAYNRNEGATARTVDLGAMQIVEESERVTVNGSLLRRGVDYTIDYQFGQLTLKPSVEIPPNSEVKVDFEEVPLFATGNTSLFGFHNEYEFDPERKNYLASTLFFQSIESVDRTFVRLGDEPKTSMLGEVGGKLEFDSDMVTRLLNNLPGFESRVPSKFQFVGGLAFSNPNPNTQGGVLIEDFETAKIENPRLLISYQAWQKSSVPKGASGLPRFQVSQTGNIFWFDPYHISYANYGFVEQDIYGVIEGRTDRNRMLPVSVLQFVFEPKGSNRFERRESWASVVQGISDTGVLGMDEREVLQIYLATGRDQGKLIIDFGEVDEDQVRFNRAGELVGTGNTPDTEDKNADGRLDYNEDTGLDGYEGSDKNWQQGADDDGNDDYLRSSESTVVYEGRYLNNTEGNNLGQIGSAFDTEDLNHDGALNRQDNVFRIELDLHTLQLIGDQIPIDDRKVLIDSVEYDPFTDQVQQYRSKLGTDSWYLLEIPLPKPGTPFANYYQEIGSPSLSNIMQLRMTIHDVEATQDTLGIAAINFVGNRFKINEDGLVPRLEETIVLDTLADEIVIPDSLLGATTSLAAITPTYRGLVELNSINTILNNEYYPPPSVQATLDKYNRSGREQDFTAQESAVRLRYRDLQKGYEGWALKAENNQQSYLDYASMSFFVNGRQGPYDPKPIFFIRIGRDENNFYEYSVPVDTGWVEITVPFQEFLTLKEELQTGLSLKGIQSFNGDFKRGSYRIKGNPTLTKVTIMALGVANEGYDVPISGEVWVNDVRLTDVIKEFGLNGRIQVEAQLSDLGRVNVSISARDNKFRNLNESIPTSSQLDYSVGSSVNLDRFAPDEWGLRLPVNYRHTFKRTTPRFHPGSEDVTIQTQESKQAFKTESKSNNVSLSYSKSRGTSMLSRVLLDKVTGSINYSTTSNLAPKNLSDNMKVSGRINYRADLPRGAEAGVFPETFLNIMDWVPLPYFLKHNTLTTSMADAKIRYLPNDFELSSTTNYNRNRRYDPISGIAKQDSTFTVDNGFQFRYNPLVSVQTNYSIDVSRNFNEKLRGSKFLGIDIGNEINRSQNVQLQVAPKAMPWFQPTYRYTAGYTNNHSATSAYTHSTYDDIRDFGINRQENINLRFMLPQFRKSVSGIKFRDPSKPRKQEESKEGEDKSSSSAYKRTPKPKSEGSSGEGIFSRFLFDPVNNFLDNFDPFTVQLSKTHNDKWNNMQNNPPFLYQIGLQNLDTETRLRRLRGDSTVVDTASFQSFQWGYTRAYQTGMRLFKVTRLSATYLQTGNNSHQINGFTFNRQEGPEFTFDYSNVYIPGFMMGIISRVDLTSSYELNNGFRANSIKMVDPEPGVFLTKEQRLGIEAWTREENWQPLIRVNASWGATGNIRTVYTRNSGVTREWKVETNQNSMSETDDSSFNLQYSFSAPNGIRLPFLKSIKLQSNVRTSLDVQQKNNRIYVQTLDDDGNVETEVSSRDTEELSITPTLSYDFAQVIGSLSARYNTLKDKKNGTKRTTISMTVKIQLDF